MAFPISVTYTFAGQTNPIPLSYLDSNFTTLVNGVNSISAGTNALSNVNITGGTITGITPLTVPVGGTGVASLTANGVVIGNGSSPVTVVLPGSSGNVLASNGTVWSSQTPAGIGLTGTVFNMQSTVTTAVTATTATIPDDNTIPQNTEGTEWMTVSITPTSATNKLLITLNASGAVAGGQFIWAIFQDSTANALYAGKLAVAASNILASGSYSFVMTAGTTSATTFKVRTGNNGATQITMNGEANAAKFGGTVSSSLTVAEIKV